MSDIAIKVENLSKQYRLGQVGTGTISHDLNRWWHSIRGKEDPYLKIGESNDRTTKGTSEYVWALQDINFEVKQGEVLGIIGKNGAGKSTLLKILSKVTSPTTGSIKARGRIASLLEVGTGFHPEMTGRENIFMNGTIMGMNRHEIASKLEEIVAFAGIAKYIDTPVKRYSSGMTVRLGFAIAAHLEPEILIVDEVLAVGDAEFQKKAIGKMQDVSKGEGRTVLFVSHNMVSVENLCTKLVVMSQGSINFTGDVHQGIKQYNYSSNKELLINIDERQDRNGGEVVRFTKFQITDADDHPIEMAFVGETICLKFGYRAIPNLENVVIRIEIKTFSGHRLSILNNYHCSSPFEKIPDSGTFCCKIHSPTLAQGDYEINAKCLVDLKEVDSIEKIGTLKIQNADYYGTGKMPNIKDGILLQQSYFIEKSLI
ncbi:ABC transporter ATP-binding protein [Reichenbachiella agariperforans]|uniref:ABC transporter ATP-binding protein n=1 Tax=Reichenbachiella agariperforans TaxID=156994 RepID=UPI001C08AAEC|nr:ABC transporter ATP-binding protein [Reichenbachiella agariperforans]MBU2915207.1 ABC transporter ATP-binding protein [Reichenbachiella agariperforans]